jgi:hypothetical protein
MCCNCAGGPVWSPRTIRKAAKAEAEEAPENPRTINLVFEALRPFRDAYAAVLSALERQVEKERGGT